MTARNSTGPKRDRHDGAERTWMAGPASGGCVAGRTVIV
jgi:hypothetical protein